jgi:hypothetical protein
MADVKNFDRVVADNAVENLVTIWSRDLHPNSRVVRSFETIGLIGYGANGRIDRLNDIERAAGAPRLEISSDFVDVSQRPTAVAHLHVTP